MERGIGYESFWLDLHRGHRSGYQLVLLAQRGNGAAFQELVRRYDAEVMRVALSLTASEAAAQDIYCRVFRDAFASVNKLDSSSSIFIWLYRILVRHCVAYCRQVEGDGRSCSGDDPASRPAGALLGLPPTERIVFQLRQFQGLKIRTLEEIFNAPPEFIIMTLENAIRRIRAQLKKEDARHPT